MTDPNDPVLKELKALRHEVNQMFVWICSLLGGFGFLLALLYWKP